MACGKDEISGAWFSSKCGAVNFFARVFTGMSFSKPESSSCRKDETLNYMWFLLE
jgi:hypothetical protein